MEVARRIMKGGIVPPTDEKKLMEYSMELYQAAKNIGALVKKAFSVTYGARNLRRTIQKELEDPISEIIIDSFENPVSTIMTQVQDGQILVQAN